MSVIVAINRTVHNVTSSPNPGAMRFQNQIAASPEPMYSFDASRSFVMYKKQIDSNNSACSGWIWISQVKNCSNIVVSFIHPK
jgi:hypothetical protein